MVYPATVTRAGEVNIQEGDKDAAFASIRPGIFEPGWQNRSASYDKASQTARIRATTAGSIITVMPTVTVNGKVLTISCAFTADKDTPLNSLHVSVEIPAAAYIGSRAIQGAENGPSVEIPATAKEVRLLDTGAGGTLTLAHPDGTGRIRVTATDPATTLLLQDGRSFGGGNLEIRAGILKEHTLQAGKTETVAFTIELPGESQLGKEEPLKLAAGPDWIPLSLSSLAIVPGSALDFSGFLGDCPAGKDGWVIARPDGHFGFQKSGKPQRFYGVNLCFTANYLTHDEADALTERLERLGYNAVRIHHYERDLIDTSAPDSLTLRADNLDKLDYLMAALKKHGIYVTTDLFVSRPVKASEMGLDAGTEAGDNFKDAVLVSRPAMENWKAFSKELLTHVNPYTKLAYKDDPTLAFISVINEPNLTDGRLGAWKGKLRDLFAAEWKAWLTKRYPGDTAKAATPLPNNLAKDATGRDLAAFFADLHQRGYNEMKTFLRNDVGTKALLTYLNGWSETPAFMAVRQSFDYVDNHFYWDHPRFLEGQWSLPSTGSSGNGSAIAVGGAGPDNIAMTRLFGKPFTVTEWDYVAPNRYRAESGLLMGTAAAIQDWDGLWHFAYSHSHDTAVEPRPIDYFNVGADPLRQAAERMGILLFRRGDANTARETAIANADASSLLTAGITFPTLPNYRGLTWVRRVGVSFTHGATSVSASEEKPSAAPMGDARSHKSDTGQVALEGDTGVLTVDTPRTVGVVAPVEKTLSAGPVTITAHTTRGVISISSLDGKPIASSHRLLLTHLTDLQNTGEQFDAHDRHVIESWGKLPYLVQRGGATVLLKRTDAAKLQAWRLDTTGKRIAPLPIKATGDAAQFELSTAAPDGSATLYYEIAIP